MKISIITMWYNEEILASIFLQHYIYADEIFILLDTNSDDSTHEICSRYDNVTVEPFTFEDGFDDVIKIKKINEIVQTKRDFDWIFALDADEFIFPPHNENSIEFLDRQQGNVVYAKMWQVYRHVTDSDLNSEAEVVLQRRHGDPSLKGFNANWVKPIIVRPEIGVVWAKGCHKILETKNVEQNICKESFLGAHWANADPDLAILRRLVSKRRQSKSNLKNRYQLHNHYITEKEIRKLCKEHENDPQLF